MDQAIQEVFAGDAVALIDGLTLVNHDLFLARLRQLVLERAEATIGVVGLYAEREVRRRKGVPYLLFKQTNKPPRRAFGSGPKPVQPTRTLDPEIGSEGIIAWLVTELCRERPEKFKSHPGPDQIRTDHIRTFMLVTDFVGSGNRAWAYIESAWRVWSVKSWHSRSMLRFEIVAYSGTDQGCIKVQSASSKS
jgi:hypothetical protein